MSTSPRSSDKQRGSVSTEQIAARAYDIWVANGRSHGHDEGDWLEAERQLGVRPTEGAHRQGGKYRVRLASVGDNKIGVVRELRELVGLELRKAKELAENAPGTILESATREEAEGIRRRLAPLGAEIEVSGG